MSLRSDILAAGQAALSVYRSSGAKERIEHEGYTRVDPLAVAASEGLMVMLQPLQSLLGAFLREERPGILVNCDRPPGLVHMTCAHELGHYFLGHETTADLTLDYGPDAVRKEQEADWFAYQLLMPRALLARLLRQKGWTAASLADPALIYQLSLRLGISFTGTIWSLYRQDIISSDLASSISKVPPKKLKEQLIGRTLAEPIGDVWLLDKSDRDVVLEPRSQDHFVVDLPNHATAGYLWSLNEAQDVGFRLKPITVDARVEGRPSPDHLRFGGERTLRYRIERQGNQENELPSVRFDFAEAQLWRGGDKDHDHFLTLAKFENIHRGLSPQSKAQLLDEAATL